MTVSPILDEPQNIDYADLAPGPVNRLANHELICWLDAGCNPHEVYWPWGGRRYAQSITLRIVDVQEGELVPLVTRFFAGHQEMIAGSEGVIVTRRLGIPYKTTDDRALYWLLECQAEGDRVLRLEIDIDWGEPLSQRIVDGLLVAQANPGPLRGLYQQSNAESTRLFGNPHGRPDQAEIDDPARARLIYHVLVNGIVEVPLIFTVSDVGEQLAWSSFLALREVEEIFDISSRNWARRLHAGRLWTPDPAFNRAVEYARLEAVRHLQRHRTGVAPSDRRVAHVPALVAAWDALDPVQSRNLLAHLRREAEASGGRLPALLAALPDRAAGAEPHTPPGSLLESNGAYLQALVAHMSHHRAPPEFLRDSLESVRLCAEALVAQHTAPPDQLAVRLQLAHLLSAAATLARRAGDTANAARWERKGRDLGGEQVTPPDATGMFDLSRWESASGWRDLRHRPHGFADPWRALQLAGAVVWQGVGLREREADILVAPAWPQAWHWWALLEISLTEDRRLSLLWDGATLHATRPVQSTLPVQLHQQIRLLNTDEFDFDPLFEMIRGEAQRPAEVMRFRPRFQQEA